MAITGTKQEGQEKMIGFAEFEVITFNPERKELMELLGSDDEEFKEPVYTGEKDGNLTCRLSIWLKNVKTGKLRSMSYFLEDKEVLSKDETKKQYVNTLGRSSYAGDEDSLPDNFKKVDYHVARVGEADLLRFVDSWLAFKNDAKVLDIEWKKLIKGNVKEFTDLLTTDFPRTICAMQTVKIQEKDGELKEFQNIYTRGVLPGYNMKNVKTTHFTDELINVWRAKNEIPPKEKTKTDWLKPLEQVVIDMTNPAYPLKDIFYLGEEKVYNPAEYIQSSSEILQDSSDLPF